MSRKRLNELWHKESQKQFEKKEVVIERDKKAGVCGEDNCDGAGFNLRVVDRDIIRKCMKCGHERNMG